jgi:GT2 family glycosyltransferase
MAIAEFCRLDVTAENGLFHVSEKWEWPAIMPGMVSIIIPNWNGKKYLRDCLEAVHAQTYTDFEVLLVDNASSDPSIEFVKTFFPEIRVIPLSQNRGFSGAANAGIKGAKGEFIALLNNDAQADPQWLEELVKAIQTSPDIGFCASKIVIAPQGAKIDAAGDTYTSFGVALKRGHALSKNRYSRKELVFGACAAAALYRRSLFAEIGLFDEDFFCTYEDVDLSFRAQLSGYRCLFVPEAVVHHIGGGTLGQDNHFTAYYGQRNLESVLFQNMPARLLLKYLPVHCSYLILAFLHNTLKGRGGIFLRAKRDALLQIERVLAKRKNIQAKRRVPLEYLERIFDRRSLWQHVIQAK